MNLLRPASNFAQRRAGRGEGRRQVLNTPPALTLTLSP